MDNIVNLIPNSYIKIFLTYFNTVSVMLVEILVILVLFSSVKFKSRGIRVITLVINIFFFLIFLYLDTEYTIMPDITYHNYTNATSLMDEKGLSFSEFDSIPSDEYVVITQNIKENELIKKTREIEVNMINSKTMRTLTNQKNQIKTPEYDYTDPQHSPYFYKTPREVLMFTFNDGRNAFVFLDNINWMGNGNWKDGYGTFSDVKFGIYEGEFLNYLKHGQGTFTWNDGYSIEGNWKDDLMDGVMTLRTPDKKYYFQYVVEDGEIIDSTSSPILNK